MKIVMKGGGATWNGDEWEGSNLGYPQIEAELFNNMGLKWTGEETGPIRELTNYLDDYSKKGRFNTSIEDIIAKSSISDIESYLGTIIESLRLRTHDQDRIWKEYKKRISDLDKKMDTMERSDYIRERENLKEEGRRLMNGFKGHKNFFEKMHNLGGYIRTAKGVRTYLSELDGLTKWNNELDADIMYNLLLDFKNMTLSGGKIIKNKRSKKGNVRNRKKLSKKKMIIKK